MQSGRTVLVVDDDAATRRMLDSTLRAAGFHPLLAATGVEALEMLRSAQPDIVLLDIVLPQMDGFEVLAHLRGSDPMRDIPVVVLTGREKEEEVARAFEAGADDVLHKPVRPTELIARVKSHLRTREFVHELARKERDAQVMLELTQALASSLDFRDILYSVVKRIAEVVRVERVSIVLAPEQGDVGYVVAASDDEQLGNLRLDLAKYPEIRQVLRTRETLTIRDATTHPVLDGVRQSVARVGVTALSLVPIVWEEQAMGVLFVRSASARGSLSDREIGFCRIVANATAVALRNARVLQSLRDQTQQVTFARFEAERRIRSMKRYADYFARAADGLAALDTDGRLLFGNPRAFQLVGFPEEELLGRKLREMVMPEDVGRARILFAGFARGDFPKNVDVKVQHKDGKARTLSVSFSPLMDGEGAVLFSFRDVTEERATAAELEKTKTFLESMISSSVDAIVAADLKGTIILFNRAAERVYGYPAADVVGKANVRVLYPDDGAREVMRMLRSAQYGGEGRLDNVRTEAIDSAGQRIPISLSAAMIYDEGKAIATFGIFTDLRDRLRTEERLAQAQQKLAITEKQALIAELAGTAAHELNQPLQSVLAYGEMLQGRLTAGSKEQGYARTIVSEAERIKEIVRKIGKITKYETKAYVGSQRILDLDKASEDEARRASSSPPRRESPETEPPPRSAPPARISEPGGKP